VSLTVDGSGRAAVATGDDARDARLETRALDAGWDLEVVAGQAVETAAVVAAVAEAEAQAGRAEPPGPGLPPAAASGSQSSSVRRGSSRRSG
jgi:hypothetical protein